MQSIFTVSDNDLVLKKSVELIKILNDFFQFSGKSWNVHENDFIINIEKYVDYFFDVYSLNKEITYKSIIRLDTHCRVIHKCAILFKYLADNDIYGI